jgi:hypothetical protein
MPSCQLANIAMPLRSAAGLPLRPFSNLMLGS